MQALQNLPSSHRSHIEVLLKHFIPTIIYNFITNTLCCYGNDKDDHVSFDYSGDVLIFLSLSLKTMMGILYVFFRVGNIVTFIIFVLWTFLISIFLAPFFHQRL